MFNLNILFFLFLILCAAGVILAATLPARRNPVALAWIGSLASLALLLLSGDILLSGHPFQIKLWQVFSLGQMLFRIDRLSALFIFSAAMVFLPVSIFTAPYMNLKKYRGRYSLKSFGIYYHLLFASLVLLLAAGDVISFLLTWEAMSIFTYLLVNYEHEKEETTRSGYLMLSLGEAGTLAAMLAFLLLGRGAAALDFASLRAAVGRDQRAFGLGHLFALLFRFWRQGGPGANQYLAARGPTPPLPAISPPFFPASFLTWDCMASCVSMETCSPSPVWDRESWF